MRSKAKEADKMKISVIIPTNNEDSSIASLVTFLLHNDPKGLVEEVLVCDGYSTDMTVHEARKAGARVVESDKKGRAAQMNAGAHEAKGDILYFLHADSFPPASYAEDISRSVDNGFQSGCYKLAFDHEHWFLRINCWFSQFDLNAVRFGDQSLYVTKEAFMRAGGFNEELIVMEDQEIIRRIKSYARFLILDNSITTSAKKYLKNGIFRLQGAFFFIFILYKLGFSQTFLQKIYRTAIRESR